MTCCLSAQIEAHLKEVPDQDLSPPQTMAQIKVVTDKPTVETILNFGKFTTFSSAYVFLCHLLANGQSEGRCTKSVERLNAESVCNSSESMKLLYHKKVVVHCILHKNTSG